jgi:diguanylate cyclase (GGDEF)-like protein
VRALIVEDSQMSQAYIQSLLAELEIDTVCASDGLSGVEFFQQEGPDLVLLDIVLPDIDGLEVARRIRKGERPGEWTPIIFLTARTTDEDLEAGIEAGGDDYLAKPINPVVLAAKLRAMQRIVLMRRELDAANRELRRLSSVDGLTGLANRRQFDYTLQNEWMWGQAQKQPLSLLMCDVDFFKLYNDNYGHPQGDECLRQVANALHEALKGPKDLAARYGGEEFAILLPNTGPDMAMMIAERARESVAALKMPHALSPLGQVSISLGVATRVPASTHTSDRLIALADRALYIAKHNGRNRAAQAVVGTTDSKSA